MYEGNNDLVINAFGSNSGGEYNNVIINGVGNINGDIGCDLLNVNGTTNVNGTVKAKKVEINGVGNLSGDVQCSKITVSGAGKITGKLVSEEIEVAGALSVEGGIKGEVIKVRGAIKALNLEVEDFQCDGSFSIKEMINAEIIEILLREKCEARELGGESIRVQKGYVKQSIMGSLFSPIAKEPVFTAETIEGDEIYLEYTKAKVVRGSKVVIGPGCEIVLVEYKESLEVNEKSKVKNKTFLN